MTQIATAVDDFAADTQGTPAAVVEQAAAAVAAPAQAVQQATDAADDFVIDDNEATASEQARDEQGRFTRTGEEPETPADEAKPQEPPAEVVEEEQPEDPDVDTVTGLKKNARPYKLVQQYQRQAEQAARETAELRARLQALEQRAPAVTEQAKPAADTLKRPSLSEFDSWEAWQAADDAWIDQRIQREAAKIQQQTQQRFQQELTQRQMAAQFDAVNSAGQKKYPDFEAVLTKAVDAGAAWSPLMTRIVLGSPSPEDLAYALAKDPETARRVAALADPVLVGVEMGTFIARVTAASTTGPANPPPVTQAKPPIKPVGSSVTAAEQSPDDLDFGPEYVRRQNEADRKRARQR